MHRMFVFLIYLHQTFRFFTIIDTFIKSLIQTFVEDMRIHADIHYDAKQSTLSGTEIQVTDPGSSLSGTESQVRDPGSFLSGTESQVTDPVSSLSGTESHQQNII